MTYGYPPGYGYAPTPGPPPKPPISAGDLTVSVIAMVLTAVGWAGAAFLGLMMMAFTDHCPPATCSIEGAVTAIMTGLAVATLVAVTGIVLTIVALIRRKRAWPVAVGTLVVCAAACVLGILGYITAVGG